MLRSARSRALLAFLVEETIAGRGERLKAYSIATLFFERDPSFDPQVDPIVRVEASKLRRALEIYYDTEGANDPIAIVLPRGSYQPDFARRTVSPPPEGVPTAEEAGAGIGATVERAKPPRARRGAIAAALAILAGVAGVGLLLHERPGMRPDAARATKRFGPSLVVDPFHSGAGSGEDTRRIAELRLDLVHTLSRFGRFEVHDGADGARTPANAYHVSATQIDSHTLLMTVRHGPSGEIIWSRAAPLADQRADLVRSVATPVASPYGAIFSHERRLLANAPDTNGEACIIRTLDALRRGDPEQYPMCLEAIVSANPHSMLAWSLLGRVYRGRYLNNGSPADLAVAREATRRGLELASLNERARLADLETRALSDPTAINPASIDSIVSANRLQADTLARAGRLEIAAGYFDRGEALIMEAGTLLPLAPIDWGMLFVADLARGRRERLPSWSSELAVANNPLTKLLAIAAAAEANEIDASTAAAIEFSHRHFQIARAPDQYLRRWGFTPTIRTLLLTRLQMAGLPPPRRD